MVQQIANLYYNWTLHWRGVYPSLSLPNNSLDHHPQEVDVPRAGTLLRQRDQQHDAKPKHRDAAPHDIQIGG